ncbi:MAG TPA: prepilin-type N-terminal cleavage/methylation domain-containing protein [Verrucomicrobiae bacterium]|nr:prepilin-type N-terminal cleavage/methylation domain-containing protein [Verrucomicrobiae bacterium]
MTRDAERGFTLIEMMIVVAIIAILVSILVPNFVRARAQAQTAACEANLKEIATALELYETDNDHYPGSESVSPSATDLGPYLKQTPVDPAAGPGYYYSFTVTDPDTSTATYTIVCPGSHDPGTLQNITPDTTLTHIQYSSTSGFAASAGP